MTFNKSLFKRLAPAVFMLALASTARLSAQSTTLHATGQELSGTWLVDVRSPVAGQFFYLITFHADGTAVGSASDGGTTSAQYGAWARSGDRQFLATMVLFVYDSDRKLVGISKGRLVITLGDTLDTFNVITERVNSDANGNEISIASGIPGTARRIAIETQKNPVTQ